MDALAKTAGEKELFNKTTVGFWLYLMTDCLLFATLFATFAVLRNATADGPTGREIFDLPVVLVETVILLTSSFSCGIGLVSMQSRQIRNMIVAFITTFVLGAAFVIIEVTEFIHLINEGHGPQASAFLSSFFTLVGTHGFHVTMGLVWLMVMLVVLWKRGLNARLGRQLTLFGLFWHFLDLIWIFVFTVVYLIGSRV